MASDDQDAFDDGAFDDWVGDIRPGAKVSHVGLLRYRQGADPRDWSIGGGSKYLPGDWHMQAGCSKQTFTARSSGGFEITFPVPFGDAPICFVSPAGTTPLFEEIRYQVTIQSNAFIEVYWWSTNNLTKLWVNWLAMGPIGL